MLSLNQAKIIKNYTQRPHHGGPQQNCFGWSFLRYYATDLSKDCVNKQHDGFHFLFYY